MNVIRSIVAVVTGFIVGSGVNMSLIMVGPEIIPPPPGVDFSDSVSLATSVHLLEAKHFVFPFLAHALGTFAGVLVGCLLSAGNRRLIALILVLLFFFGGKVQSFIDRIGKESILLDLLG